MLMKRVFPFVFSVMLVLSFNSSAQAEFFSVSAGVPVAHNLSNSDLDADGVSGYLVHFKLPIMLGLGLESYETKIDHTSDLVTDMKLKTTMYDIFWLLPIPIINITIGAGLGSAEMTCDVAPDKDCGFYYDKGAVTQFWGQFGVPIFPFIDLHVSYHQISGDVKGKEGADDESVDSTLYAIGASIIF